MLKNEDGKKMFGLGLGNIIVLVCLVGGFLLQSTRFEVHTQDAIDSMMDHIAELRAEMQIIENDVGGLGILRAEIACMETKLDMVLDGLK